MAATMVKDGNLDYSEDEEENFSDDGDWGDWKADDSGVGGGEEEEDDDDSESDFLCLFCDSHFVSCDLLFEHCSLRHGFDFHRIRNEMKLDFYSSFKLINYIRSQVAENKCWSWKIEADDFNDVKFPWDEEKYLKPVWQEDSLLYSFADDEEDEEDTFDREEVMEDLRKLGDLCIDVEALGETSMSNNDKCNINGNKDVTLLSDCNGLKQSSADDLIVNGKDAEPKVCDGRLVNRNIKKVNENYFGSYSSFGIHKEMLNDKVRTEAYRDALLKNPTLLSGSVVMDVGCGTGILSLFAAKAGASRVVAVEASEKMAKVASKIAKDNKVFNDNEHNGVLEVAHSMVEELDKSIQIQAHSVDVLVSEWMGYCLLYESMLSSVLYARDRWLKPGGAILPDTATMFVAGFGKGATSLPFWEDVYGFDMSSIGKEILEDTARLPIVDVIEERDLVTQPALLQTFDLSTMKPDEVDFTATATLKPTESEAKTRLCHGVVLWFDTGFTNRFCKENPTVLSTSPYTPPTHWAQTVLTFQEPISVAPASLLSGDDRRGAIGTKECPASSIHLRMSVARAHEHRSIDISLEATGLSSNGQKRRWPVQIFNL
ncbi:probable protein arginine N-methyltransferase 3 [Arabidopsis lyrata subsp. lyrata]|uniref:probable protein arginine N-methyltransferase 3 n=1 Tax=Arabidopsis lyrata subsp. lyrata TaxID=81972 RepID=UPI000A29BCC7|nr:probable protein arginine N-methyltransferase 3 [Arabidopsis lyrata subsp. lyrata]|eukprot:XP_020888237.1 probable protein arginine N-methyltransferase 3 [Arabidopsis lyrata subsp. lyrata]